jgi:hypothetical protein
VSTNVPTTGFINTYDGRPMLPAPRRLHLVADPQHPATAELLIPTKPPLPRHLSPRRLPLWRRVVVNLLTPDCAPEAGVGATVAFAGLAVVAAAYAIFQLLTSGAA